MARRNSSLTVDTLCSVPSKRHFFTKDLAKLLEQTTLSDEDYQKALKDNYEEHLAIFHEAEKGKQVAAALWRE